MVTQTTPSRVGNVQGNSDPWELFLDVFGGEVLTAFETQVKFADKVRNRTLESGKSADFPAIYKALTSRHTVGTEIIGQAIASKNVNIALDDKLIAPVFIADVDEAMSHFEFREAYTKELGNALAVEHDKNIMRSILLAARGGALFTGDQGGSTLTGATFGSNAAALFDGLSLAKQTLDEKDVPVEMQQVNAAVKAAQWYLMARSDKNLNRDFNGSGANNQSHILNTIDDIQIIKSNALPFGKDETLYHASTNTDGIINGVGADAIDGTQHPSKYYGDWSTTVATVWTEYAAATVRLMEMGIESDGYQVSNQGTLIVGKLMTGHGALRNKCAVELKTA